MRAGIEPGAVRRGQLEIEQFRAAGEMEFAEQRSQGLAVLQEIVEGDLCGNARVQGQRLRLGLERLMEKYSVIGDIRGKGLFLGIEFVRDRSRKESFPPDIAFGVRVGRRALENGLLTRFDPNWLALGPPLTVTEEQIDEIVAILEESIGECLAE